MTTGDAAAAKEGAVWEKAIFEPVPQGMNRKTGSEWRVSKFNIYKILISQETRRRRRRIDCQSRKRLRIRQRPRELIP